MGFFLVTLPTATAPAIRKRPRWLLQVGATGGWLPTHLHSATHSSPLSTGRAGAQQRAFISGSRLPAMIEAVVASLDGAVGLNYEPNPGRSDASHLWRSLPTELRGERVLPFTCGPGHRSHRGADGVRRKTHGPNEGFDKVTGQRSFPFFVALARRLATT
jgi:hypothetical protein